MPRRFPLFRKRSVYLPTWRGMAIIIGIFALFGWFLITNLYPFLAVKQSYPEDGSTIDLLCIEGWVQDKVIEDAAEMFASKRYKTIGVIGGYTGKRDKLLGFKTYAKLGAHRLEANGIPAENIITATPYYGSPTRRTLHDIASLKKTLDTEGIEYSRLLVISRACHTRRTLNTYRRVFGDEVEIKGFSSDPTDYSRSEWWKVSQGLKETIMEAISWGYETLNPGNLEELQELRTK